MKRLLLFMLLLVTGLAPSWADKLKLHVTDMQEHNVANVKLRIGYDDAQYQTTDATGYVTFNLPNGFYESLGSYGATFNLEYESDEYDVDDSGQPTYRFSTSTEFKVYAQDKGQTVNATFEEAQFFQFDFTKHLTQLQRNYLSGKALSFTVFYNYNDGHSSTRTILYKGESKKNLFLRTDKSCYKITCRVSSDYFGNVNNTIAELANGAIYLPANIGVDLTTGRIPVTLNSLTGVDGKAVTEGQVGAYNLANGLPAVIGYVGNDDYNKSVNCLLKNYQGFTYHYTLDSNNSFDLDLQNKGKEVTCTLKNHDGSPMANAEVLTLKRNNYTYSYDSLLVTTSNAQGEAHYYKVQSIGDIMPWPIYINPNQKGYAGTEINPYDDDDDNTVIVIDYSKQKFVTLRIKNFNTDEWNKLYTQEIDFGVSYAIAQNEFRDTQTTSFNDGNDLVLRSFIDKSEAAKACDLDIRAKLYANSEAGVLGVLPYVVHLETLPSGDLDYTIAPLEWRKVKMEYALPKDLTLECERISVDNVSFEYNNEVYDDDETNNSLLMPAGQHKLSMRFASPSFLYDFGPEQTFNVTNNAQPQVATYTLLPQNYAGYTVTAIAPNGQPAADYELAVGEERVSLNDEGKGGIYLSKLTGANNNQLKTLHYQISSNSDYIIPYKWTGNVDNGIQQKTIHFDTEYYKYDVTVKTKEEDRYPQTVIDWATTAQKLEVDDQEDNTLSTDDATLHIYDWNHDEGSNLYSQTIYLPKGWVKGVTTLDGNEYALKASQVTANGALTFDFTTFSKVTFTYDGENSAPGYGGELLLMRMADKKQISTYGNSLLLQPGEYKACYIGFQENGDMYYVQMPTKTFTVMGDGNDLNVNMVSAADEDYVNVRLSATGLDDAAGKLTYAEVYVVYDGLFVLTERNNGECYSFNSISPWKMLKGHYDFKVEYVRLNYKNSAIVYNIDGQIDVKDNSSTFNIDFTGNHVFTSLAFVDAQGQAIDWNAMGLSVAGLKVIDDNGYAKSMDYIGSFGLIIANGDYKVEVYTYDDNHNLTVHEATLHVNNQAGKVAAISMNNLTGVASTVAADNKLQAKKEGNSLWVNGRDNEPIEVAVYNISGVCVLHTTANNNECIDLDSLMRGTYIVRLRQGNHNTSIKVLK